VRVPIRLAVLVALFSAGSFVAAQITVDRIGAVTSALRAGQFDKALQLLQPKLEQNPKNAQLWTLRGLALSGKGDKREALGAFHRALGRDGQTICRPLRGPPRLSTTAPARTRSSCCSTS